MNIRWVTSILSLLLAATIMAGLIGLVINLVIGWVERRWFGWESTTRDGA